MIFAISFGAPTALEVEMAKLITEIVPSVEMVRMVNSGTEATMSAISLARGFTKEIKLLNLPEITMDMRTVFLIQAGSGATNSWRAKQSRNSSGCD